MPIRAQRLVLLASFLVGCSEPNGLEAGTFEARLSGATSVTLTGESSAGVIYVEEQPDGLYIIRMVKPEGDVTRIITVSCPGTSVPDPGSHSLDPAEGGCTGRYSRFTLEPTLETLEEMESAAGTVRLQQPSGGQTAGSFNFSGELVRGTDSLGTVQASGNFNAVTAP
jgi:hypothetical protein